MSEQMLILQNDRLKVEIAYPGSGYRGSRFDWTGFVTQVTLDGRHTFCVPESLVPGRGSGGAGLCNEFGIHEPIGYEDAAVGEQFSKLGVGLLTRPDGKPYDFFRPYEIQPFPVHVETGVDKVVFTSEPLACRGYAARLTKSLSIQDNKLLIEYRLENVGERSLKTTEYVHNFIGIDGHRIGPDYELRLPYPIELSEPAEIFELSDNRISWRWTPESDFYCIPGGFPGGEVHQWELMHKPSGVGIREESRLPVGRVCLWGTTHVASPEVFIGINLAPGDTQTWSRGYEFLD